MCTMCKLESNRQWSPLEDLLIRLRLFSAIVGFPSFVVLVLCVLTGVLASDGFLICGPIIAIALAVFTCTLLPALLDKFTAHRARKRALDVFNRARDKRISAIKRHIPDTNVPSEQKFIPGAVERIRKVVQESRLPKERLVQLKSKLEKFLTTGETSLILCASKTALSDESYRAGQLGDLFAQTIAEVIDQRVTSLSMAINAAASSFWLGNPSAEDVLQKVDSAESINAQVQTMEQALAETQRALNVLQKRAADSLVVTLNEDGHLSIQKESEVHGTGSSQTADVGQDAILSIIQELNNTVEDLEKELDQLLTDEWSVSPEESISLSPATPEPVRLLPQILAGQAQSG